MEWAIDGCNLPTPAFPLDRLARLYATIADAPAGTPLARIFDAMTKHPELVAGEGRFCTLLMQCFGGALIAKASASSATSASLFLDRLFLRRARMDDFHLHACESRAQAREDAVAARLSCVVGAVVRVFRVFRVWRDRARGVVICVISPIKRGR